MDKTKTQAAQAKAQQADDKASSIKGKTKDQLAKEVKGLLVELRATTDGEQKKSIRRKLRARGHFGGLGERNVQKKAVKVKNKRAKKVQAPVETVAHAEAA